MAAPPCNEYWKFRSKDGREPKYKPEELWKKFIEYMQWLSDNPIYEYKAMNVNKTAEVIPVPKMRAATMTGFCLFADITLRTYENYRKREDYFRVLSRIDAAIRTQKFEGAAAEQLNPMLVARDLGLRDAQQVDHTTKGDKVTTNIVVQQPELSDDIKGLLNKLEGEK